MCTLTHPDEEEVPSSYAAERIHYAIEIIIDAVNLIHTDNYVSETLFDHLYYAMIILNRTNDRY